MPLGDKRLMRSLMAFETNTPLRSAIGLDFAAQKSCAF
jgi:hypothetical protein